MDSKDYSFMFARYLFLIIIAIPSLYLFYLIFTPLTSYPVFFFLEKFHSSTIISQPTIILSGTIFDGKIISFYNSISNIPILSSIANVLFDPPRVFTLKGYYAELIAACIAGSAYYFLLILNLTTPMTIRKRTYSLIFILLTFLILNIARILIFATMLKQGYEYFDLTHMATWYFGSTIMVVLIWFANVLIFKIDRIPIYHDIKSIIADIK